MITDIIYTFKTIYNLKKAEIARDIGISVETIDHHRRHPETEMSSATSGLLSSYIVNQLRDRLDGLSYVEREEILEVVGKNAKLFNIEIHRLAIQEAWIIAMKKFKSGPWKNS